MLRILSSTTELPSSSLREAEREGGRAGGDNIRWLASNFLTDGVFQLLADGSEPTYCLLLGGRGIQDFRLRVAQSHMRHDLTPSHWSHVAMLAPSSEPGADRPFGWIADSPDWEATLAKLELVEISLEPVGGFGFPAPNNGLQRGRLGQYRSRQKFPNIALLRLPIARTLWQKAPADASQRPVLDRFREQRSVLDATQLLLEWLSFLWGVGRSGNPLFDGHGIPSAAMIEIVLSAAGFDITPGVESRASCPEAIWQAAKWWQKFYEDKNTEPIGAVYAIGDRIGDWPSEVRSSHRRPRERPRE